MLTLTVRQPFAWGLIFGQKRIENRSRPTRHRGPLGIHAGLSRADFVEVRRELFPGLPPVEDLHFGMVIGLVDVVDCVPFEEVAGQPHAEGPWCWITANPRPVIPIAWRGSLGLFRVPEERFRPWS